MKIQNQKGLSTLDLPSSKALVIYGVYLKILWDLNTEGFIGLTLPEAIHGHPNGNVHSCSHTLSCCISLSHCYFVHGEDIYHPNNDQFGAESMHL